MIKKDLDYYMNLNWTYRFEWSDEDNGYVASVAELKGCMSFGETIEEATVMIKDALLSYLDCCLAYHDEIPEPVKAIDCKGKISYRTTPEQHYKIAKRANSLNMSINAFIDQAVTEKLQNIA